MKNQFRAEKDKIRNLIAYWKEGTGWEIKQHLKVLRARLKYLIEAEKQNKRQ